jgi:hypothetical protein
MTILYFHCDFSNIQKCSFKDCPFIWVTPLIVFLSFNYWGGSRLTFISNMLWNLLRPNFILKLVTRLFALAQVDIQTQEF